MPDEISRLSAEVARDPSSRASIHLAEALRRAGRLDSAREAARRALGRHPYDADAHDVYARVAAEQGDEVGAMDEWEMALRLDQRHVGALLGLAFLAYRRADVSEASRRATVARSVAPDDARVVRVGALIDALVEATRLARRPDDRSDEALPPERPAAPSQTTEGALTATTLFVPVLAEGAHAALLVDGDGLVVVGAMHESWRDEIADDMAAELSGLGVEATRALEQLGLGRWEGLSVECDAVTLSIAPAIDERLVVVATADATPKGMARVLLARARQRAERWLETL